MHGPTRILWANLTPCSLKAAALAGANRWKQADFAAFAAIEGHAAWDEERRRAWLAAVVPKEARLAAGGGVMFTRPCIF